MKIKYSLLMDKKIIGELNEMSPRLSQTFGFSFPFVRLDDEKVLCARKVALASDTIVDRKKMCEIAKKIYGKDFPKVDLFVNSTDFSTWDTEMRFISVSYKRFPEKITSSFCHEANHYMYDLVFKTQKYEDTQIKETLTVLNTLFDIKDYGWEKFKKQREDVLLFFKNNKDINEVVAYAKKLKY